MSNLFDGLTSSDRRRVLVNAAKKWAEAEGYAMTREPGRGKSNTWSLTKDGKTYRVSIRTTQDRRIAFPPVEGGTKWKTLDDVQLVLVATVDAKEDPEAIDVYMFPAEAARKHFVAAYTARQKANQVQIDDFGIWVHLDPDSRGLPISAGTGLSAKFPRKAKYAIKNLVEVTDAVTPASPISGDVTAGTEVINEPHSVPEVMAWARERIAKLVGVPLAAIKLEFKVEF